MSARTAIASSLVLLLLVPATASAGIVCWTNKEGVRECGNAVPPEYAQGETVKLNQRGIVIEVKEAAKTAEERAEAARRAEEQKERERRQAEQAREDWVLLSTFHSERDILLSRDNKLGALEAGIKIAEGNIEGLRDKQAKLQQRADDQERLGKTVPEGLLEDLADLERQIANRERFIRDQRQAQAEVSATHDAYLERFRTLKKTQ